MSVCLLYTVWNRASLLSKSLERLSELSLPDEILVVDDGSTDHVEQVCGDAVDRLGLPLRRVYTHNPGESQCSHARNVGIKSTDAEYVITCEPEMWFETDVIAQLLDRVPDHPEQIVNVGRVLHEQPAGQVCGCGCGQLKHETVNFSATWTCLYKRQWLMNIGGWDEFGWPDPWGWEDVELCTRLRISGVGQFNDLGAVATHMWHPTRICRQDRNEAYFRSKPFLHDERPDHPELIANQGLEWGKPILP